MPDRAIVARLRAEATQFLTTMGKAAKATEQVGESADKSSKKATGAFDRMAKSVRANSQHIDRLGNAAIVAGGAITAGLGLGVKAFADFDEAMSSVNAALPEAGAKMENLRQLAINLGKDTQFSTTEAAQGITELAKAGVSAEAILGGGLKGSLDLAAAGGLEVARAAEVSATALKQFNLQGSDLPHVADLYSAAAGKAQGSVEDIAQAMKFAGVTANGLGISLDETVGTLGLFAEAGIIGEQAGTSLRSLLLSLTAPSVAAAGKMAELGISVYDAQGSFIGIGGAAQELQTELGKLDEETRNAALGTIFGNESINAARELYEGGASAVAKWTGQVNDAGFAAEQAAAKTDNLKGDIERLGGALDAVFVQNGEGANGVLRDLVQSAEGAVEAFGSMPQGAQQAAIGLAGITGAGLLAAGMLARGVTAAADFSESLDAIRTKSPKAAKGIDLTTKAMRGFAIAAAALTVIGAIENSGISGSLGLEQLTKDLLAAGDAATVVNGRFDDLADFDDRADSNIRSLGDALQYTFDPGLSGQIDNSIDAIFGAFGRERISDIQVASKRLGELDSALSGLVASGNGDRAAEAFKSLAREAEGQGFSVDQLKEKLPQYAEALAAVDNQQTLTGGSADGMADDIGSVEKAADDARSAVDDLAAEIRNFGKTAIDADEAQSNFDQGVADFSKTVKDNAQAVKDGEKTKADARRDNLGSLRDLATLTLENSAATLEAGGSIDQAAAKVETGRAAFIKAAGQLGITGKAAEELADKYGLIPEDVTTTVKAEGATAARISVQNLIDTIAALNSKSVTVGVRYVVTGTRPGGGRSTAGGITADADGAMHVRSGTGLVKAYADGGVHSLGAAQPQIARAGGAGILWAEEGAGPWEAFISGHPGKRNRSRAIASDTVERLGGRVEWRRFADGGFLGGGGPTAISETRQTPVFVTGPVSVGTLGEIADRAEAEEWRKAMGQQL